MANKRIDQLNENLDPLTGDELIPIFDSVNNKTEKISLNTIFNFIDGNVTGNTLSQTLSIGNTTGGNNIIITSGDTLTSNHTNAQISFGKESKRPWNNVGENQTFIEYNNSTYIEMGEFENFQVGVTDNLMGIDLSANNLESYIMLGSVYHGGIEITTNSDDWRLVGLYASGVSTQSFMEVYNDGYVGLGGDEVVDFYTPRVNKRNGWGTSRGFGTSSISLYRQTLTSASTVTHTMGLSSFASQRDVFRVKYTISAARNNHSEGLFGEISAVFRWNGSVMSQIGSTEKTMNSEFSTADFNLNISGVNIQLTINGDTSKTIDWRMLMEATVPNINEI